MLPFFISDNVSGIRSFATDKWKRTVKGKIVL